MSSQPSALFAYPKQAEFARPLPKNKIYERSGANSRLKDLFVEQVEQIVWRYKLAPETINLPTKPGVPEIQVFAIQLKTQDLHRDVLRCIDGAVQYPIIFELTQGQGAEARTQVVAAYKRPSEADAASWVCSDYFESDWTPSTTERIPLPLALDLGGLYEQLLRRLVPVAARPSESLGVQVIRAEQVRAKEREVAQAQVRLAKEKQFNRKVEINSTLRQLKAELKSLTSQ
ncbi:MAG: DUF4391 domain-containing protein [Hydrogenophaga sp.]|uniref:DUF4391 domain-containing protein n=1 Tax=Hydrogenophaga sp. TaxID=1904254 RepID=UPI001DA0FD4A|nr:DUF4391 domain-containing protein [Hydrogenophaga sp.]MBW0171433.1 DUF4391 domain-containing protein [Hydrogenophaga sp.]MBW0184301.1 DUF4391 domain-containing protein [Hydrogenophaga sp.]